MKDEMRQRHRISDSDSQATTCCLDLNWKEKSISYLSNCQLHFSHGDWEKCYVNCDKSERVANCPWRDSKYNFASLCCVAQLCSAARIRAENIADYVIWTTHSHHQLHWPTLPCCCTLWWYAFIQRPKTSASEEASEPPHYSLSATILQAPSNICAN